MLFQELNEAFRMGADECGALPVVVGIYFGILSPGDKRRSACPAFQLVGGVLEGFHLGTHARFQNTIGIDVPLPTFGVLPELVARGGLDVVHLVPAQFVDVPM